MIFDHASEEASRSRSALSQDVLEYEQMAKQAASSGQLLTAIEVARDGLARFGDSKVLRQQLALALAQTGALDAAREVLGELMKQSAGDEETLSLLGRVHKELWRRAANPAEGAAALKQACKFYGDAFALREAYYPGINLAFTLAASGDLAGAEQCARKVAKLCRAEIAQAGDAPDGWLLATLGEALVHQGDTGGAADYYRRAAEIFKGRWRDLASMRRQAREIIGFAKAQPEATRSSWRDFASMRRSVRGIFGRTREAGQEWLDRCFDFPSVVVFSGHMIDQPGRAPSRFPAAVEPQVRAGLLEYLQQIKPGFGYSSAACGSDIVFCECLLELGAKVNLVLPCPVDAFKRQSVAFAGAEWERRFHHVLAHATTCLIANPAYYGASATDPALPMGLVYSNQIVTGLAALQAQALDLDLQALAVWDGRPGDGPGGTASVVAEWTRRQLKPHVIGLDGRPADVAAVAAAVPAAPPPGAPGIRQEIKTMMFAGVLNHQKVGEGQIPAFVHEFKGAMAKVMAEHAVAPVVTESWGGAHYFVFDGLEEAALFALDLRDEIGRTAWGERGLPADLGIRVVLHAAPVFSVMDPVLKRPTCIGSHVTRAARLEMMTPQGQVYATQEFAALCGAEGVGTVSLEFLGHLSTTRLFEDAPLFRLDRKRRSSP